MAPRTSVVVSMALIAAVIMSAATMTTVEAKTPTCDSCMKSGHPYLCKATMQSGACFNGAGDAVCDGNGCTCCKKQAGPGCQSCDAADEDEDEDDE